METRKSEVRRKTTENPADWRDALAESERRLQHVIDLSSDYYWEQDEHYRFARLRRSSNRKRPLDPEYLLGKTRWELGGTPVESAGTWDEHKATLCARKAFADFVVRYAFADGHELYISTSGRPLVDAGGRFKGYCGISKDVTETKRDELARLRESEERYSSTVELAAIGISHVGLNGRFIHVNRQLCEMLGYTREEFLALTVKQISHPDDLNVTDEARAKLRAGKIDSFKVEKRYLRKDGTAVWVRITVALKRDPSGAPLHDISIVEDISDRKRAEERVQYLATHDEMTNLPNRVMFTEMLRRAIDSARRHNRKLAVLFIDLDRFKLINDSLGHAAGDQLLKEIALRLKGSLRASDLVARFGGDEFILMLDEIKEAEGVSSVARNLLSLVIKPLEIMGNECRVTASIGVSTFPDDGDDAQALMKSADLAMYVAKEEGKNNYQFYSKEASSVSIERLALETHLRRALERNEFTLQYQAKVNIKTSEVTGVEALLRWWNRDLGAVSPARFIRVAEDTGLIVPIGKWVLNTACAQNVAWQRQGLPPIRMAVNVSPRQFKDPSLLRDISDVLEQTGLAPDLLELEITEGVVMHDIDQAVKELTAIKDLGVRLAIDDFGTGYSSLARLKCFPIDTLKVDRSFIRDIPRDSEDKAITEAIIAMGRTLDVTLVAEGVETAEQEAFLESRACDEMQGFYFCRPSHPDVVGDLLRKHIPAYRD